MLDPVRLVTIHPALVHFTLGVLPIAVVGYGVAAWRRSERWTFAGDLAVWLGALVTLGTLAFGLVSNAVLFWPGGLELWRWLHLVFACLSTALLLAIAIVRLRRRTQPAGWRTLGAALALAGVLGFTGWIGGEVLVFHGGMGVKAAAGGVLSPPLGSPPARPADLHDGMAAIRAEWAAAVTATARSIGHEPSPQIFAAAAQGAERLRALSLRVVELGGSAGHPGPEFASLGQQIGTRAEEVLRAASAQDLQSLAERVGRLTSVCARCHDSYRF